MKKTRRSRLINILTVLGVTAAVAAVLLLIRPAGDKPKMPEPGGDVTVSVTIECPDILKEKNYKKLSQSVKDSGLLDGGDTLAEQSVSMSDATALEALKAVCDDNELSLDIKPAAANGMTDYVYGIGGLCEGDCTKRSGWVYYIDGVEPDVGLGDYLLADGSELRLEFIVY